MCIVASFSFHPFHLDRQIRALVSSRRKEKGTFLLNRMLTPFLSKLSSTLCAHLLSENSYWAERASVKWLSSFVGSHHDKMTLHKLVRQLRHYLLTSRRADIQHCFYANHNTTANNDTLCPHCPLFLHLVLLFFGHAKMDHLKSGWREGER